MLLCYLHLTLNVRYPVCQHWAQISLYTLCVDPEPSPLHFWFPYGIAKALFALSNHLVLLPDMTFAWLWRAAWESNKVLLWEHGTFTWRFWLIEPKHLIESASAGLLTTKVKPAARFNSAGSYEPLTSCVQLLHIIWIRYIFL